MAKFIELCEANGLRVYEDSVALVDIARFLRLGNLRQYGWMKVGCAGITKKRLTTNGGLRTLTFVNDSVVRRIVSKMRYPVDNTIYEALDMRVGEHSIFYPSEESCFIKAIETVFRGEKMCRQYVVDGYEIDLYFEEYNLAVEIDEYGHISQHVFDDHREKHIQAVTACMFVRCKTHEANAVFECCAKIYEHIRNHHSLRH